MYIQEAHPSDVWQMPSNIKDNVVFASPKDEGERTNLAGVIRMGCPQDFASILPQVLSRFALLYPRMQIELLVEGNASLLEAVHSSRIDLAVIIGAEGSGGGEIIGHLEISWIASSSFTPPPQQPLPLAVLGPKCPFRRCAIDRLEAAGVKYRIAANSPSLDGLWAALRAGLGLTARTSFNLPDGLVFDRVLHGLPTLGALPVALHRNPSAKGQAADHMEALLTDILERAFYPEAGGKALRRPAHRASRRVAR